MKDWWEWEQAGVVDSSAGHEGIKRIVALEPG